MSDEAKVVLWGTGVNYNAYLSLIKLCEEMGKIEVVGIVTKDKYFKEYDGYPLIDEIDNSICDYIICMAPTFYLEIIKEASFMGIPASKIIRVDVFGQPGFTFEKWNRLFESRLSIIAQNCWGGFTYNHFGLPFLSPFINMYENDNEFITFLEGDIKETLSKELCFEKVGYNPVDKMVYPIYSLNGMAIYMNHYNDCVYAEQKWKERTAKINYDNLLIMMYTESVEIAKRFSELKYDKKICFTTFDSDFSSCLNVVPYTDAPDVSLWKYINDMAFGRCTFYDPWELLLNGNIVLRGKLS